MHADPGLNGCIAVALPHRVRIRMHGACLGASALCLFSAPGLSRLPLSARACRAGGASDFSAALHKYQGRCHWHEDCRQQHIVPVSRACDGAPYLEDGAALRGGLPDADESDDEELPDCEPEPLLDEELAFLRPAGARWHEGPPNTGTIFLLHHRKHNSSVLAYTGRQLDRCSTGKR